MKRNSFLYIMIGACLMLIIQSCQKEYSQPISNKIKLPELPEKFKGKIYYSSEKEKLILKGYLSYEERKELLSVSTDTVYQDAVNKLFEWSFSDETMTEGFLSVSIHSSLRPVLNEIFSVYEKEHAKVELNIKEHTSVTECLNDVSMERTRSALVMGNIPLDVLQQLNVNTKPIVYKLISRDAVCMIANPNVKKTFITSAELVKILTGKMKSWKEFSKDDKGITKPIKIYAERNGFLDILLDSLHITHDVASDVVVYCSNKKEIIDEVHKSKNVIGIVGMNDAKFALVVKKEQRDTTSFKLFSLAKTEKNTFYRPYQAYVYQNKYLFSIPIYFIFRNDIGQLPLGFSSYLAYGAGGQTILMNAGLVPMTQRIKFKNE